MTPAARANTSSKAMLTTMNRESPAYNGNDQWMLIRRRSAYYDGHHQQQQQNGYYDDRGQQGYQDEYYNDQYYDQGGAQDGYA
jgi:hypothetical protein